MRTTAIVIVVASLLIGWWYRFGATELAFKTARPLAIGEAFKVPVTDLDGRRRSVPLQQCTPIFIVDAYCAGCRSAAHEWRADETSKRAVWLIVNTRAEASAFYSMFLETPPHFYIAHRPQRLRAFHVIQKLGLADKPNPLTLVLDAQGVVRHMMVGIVKEPKCNSNLAAP